MSDQKHALSLFHDDKLTTRRRNFEIITAILWFVILANVDFSDGASVELPFLNVAVKRPFLIPISIVLVWFYYGVTYFLLFRELHIKYYFNSNLRVYQLDRFDEMLKAQINKRRFSLIKEKKLAKKDVTISQIENRGDAPWEIKIKGKRVELFDLRDLYTRKNRIKLSLKYLTLNSTSFQIFFPEIITVLTIFILIAECVTIIYSYFCS